MPALLRSRSPPDSQLEGFTDIKYQPQSDIEGVARGDIDFWLETAASLATLLDAGKPVTVLARSWRSLVTFSATNLGFLVPPSRGAQTVRLRHFSQLFLGLKRGGPDVEAQHIGGHADARSRWICTAGLDSVPGGGAGRGERPRGHPTRPRAFGAVNRRRSVRRYIRPTAGPAWRWTMLCRNGWGQGPRPAVPRRGAARWCRRACRRARSRSRHNAHCPPPRPVARISSRFCAHGERALVDAGDLRLVDLRLAVGELAS